MAWHPATHAPEDQENFCPHIFGFGLVNLSLFFKPLRIKKTFVFIFLVSDLIVDLLNLSICFQAPEEHANSLASNYVYLFEDTSQVYFIHYFMHLCSI